VEVLVRIVAAALSVLWIVLAGTLWPASAWNDTGHQVIALIAWDNLAPETRSKLVAMMRQAEAATRLPSLFPEDKRAMEVRGREFFRRAATWPDLIRSVPELHHPTWHHRDFYWRQDKDRAIDLPDLQVHPENLLERLHHFKKLLANPTVPARGQAIGIAWVLHLVGDVHQPFHCSARVTAVERKGDHGGQDFELAPLSSPRPAGERYSLHAYWDDMLDRAVPRRSGERLGVYLQRAAALVVSQHPRAQREAELKPGQFDAWARESVVAAQSAYPASLRRGQEPSADYRNLSIQVAFGRLALAGYRLALMLREVAGVAGP
jgi:hypothetical protein